MKRSLFLYFLLLTADLVRAQTPVIMAQQPALTYTEDFSDIKNWSNGFNSGMGAGRFSGTPAGGTGNIPNGTHLTHSTNYFVTGSSGGIQKDTVNNRLLMLATGTTDNTNAAAVDFYMDFTGIEAGTLSFDWASINNGASTSNRKGSLRVYGSTDAVNFTELTGAEVLNIINYAPSSGTILNVALPVVFNYAPQAILRFYYYNGTGGTSGSRPMIALDNLSVTATGIPCTTPAASASTLSLSAINATTIQMGFQAASPAPDEYLVIASVNNSLTSNPANGIVYNPGDNVGDGIVVYRGTATNLTIDSLNPATSYHFFIFSSNVYCNGIISYRTIDPLNGIQATPAGPPCAPPGSQASGLQFSNATVNTIQGTFNSAMGASGYLVVHSASAAPPPQPVNGTMYVPGGSLGGAIVDEADGDTSFVAQGLSHSTTYYFHIYAYNNAVCSGGPVYLSSAPLSGQQSTAVLLPCATPSDSASDLILKPADNYINGFFNPYPGNADEYLVIYSPNAFLSSMPQDGHTYTVGDLLGGGKVLSIGNNYSFTAQSLDTGTAYYFFVFSSNSNCLNGPKYQTNSYLSGSAATTSNPGYHYYFGNLHAHSSFSDGNKDSTSWTPADDYAYARNAQCMDFLGISDHNHYTASDNPGMLRQYYQQGLTQADSFSSANPNFLALYGMEWGVLNNGGHVLIYGIDSLLGWETINGLPNYDTYVPKSDYLSQIGLFSVINGFSSQSVFASLAHPSWSDFGELAYLPYNVGADSAIWGVAIESGPAFSSNSNYGDPGSDQAFLPYYQHLLSLGYRVSPQIDHDNHNSNFGTISRTRTGVIAPSLDKEDFMGALHRGSFYATQDCDTRASISIYGMSMGSELEHAFAPAITVNATDPTDTGAPCQIRLMSGVPGSGLLPSVLTTAFSRTLNYTDHALADSSARYYYAEILIGSDKTVTAPVWYHRLDTGSVTVSISDLATTRPESMEIVQNPAGSMLRLELGYRSNERVLLHVYDLMGLIRRTEELVTEHGKTVASVSLDGLPEGMYLVEVGCPHGRVCRSFIHY